MKLYGSPHSQPNHILLKRHLKLVQNCVLAPSVLLPPLIHKPSEGSLCSQVATFTIIYNSSRNNHTNCLVVEHYWGEEALSYSCQCSLPFSVFFFFINSVAPLLKHLKKLVLYLKCRRSRESKRAFFCTQNGFLLDCTRGAGQCLPAPAAHKGILPWAFLQLNSETRSQVCIKCLFIRARNRVRGVRHSPWMQNLKGC